MKELLTNIMTDFINCSDCFCSEADFQFNLAWRIKEEIPDANVILEYPIREKNKNKYIDIYVSHNNKEHFIELKYKTKSEEIERYGNKFILANQSAQDVGRYSFCKDIERLESMKNKNSTNYAIFLTNDTAYCIDNDNMKSLDTLFRIHQGKTLNGILNWNTDKKEHWTADYPPINIKGAYKCDWKGSNSKKYLILEVIL